MTAGLYRTIRDDVFAIFNAAWAHPDVPVFWRSNDLEPLPDPSDVPHFLRNEVDFGRETLVAFGAGRGANLKVQLQEMYESRSFKLGRAITAPVRVVRAIVKPGEKPKAPEPTS